jgi:cysteine desulfurase
MASPTKPIYLDYHATTPVDHSVIEAMMPWFTEHFGNPASRSHTAGWQASEAVEIARSQVAALLYSDPQNIIFTSGSTEGLNMAIKGLAETAGKEKKHIISLTTEHHAVLDPLEWLQRKGYEITLLSVGEDGLLDPERLTRAIRNDTIMVIVMWANNETGVIQPIKSIGAICKQAGIPLISDATQAIGKIPVDPMENGVDIIALSAHKFYGPKGVGALYINPALKIKPAALIHGGGHERGFRSGTLNVPGIVGLGAAAHLRQLQKDTDATIISNYRDHFESLIMSSLEEVSINGTTEQRLSTVSNLKVRYVDSQAVMNRFRSQLAISSGSACSSAHPEPSHVLMAMGLTDAEAKGSFRISFGVPSTLEEITRAAELLIKAIKEERSQSPVWQMFKQGIDLS